MELKSKHGFARIFFKDPNGSRHGGAVKLQGLSTTAFVFKAVVVYPATGTKTEEGCLSVMWLEGTVARERADFSEFHLASSERRSISHQNLQVLCEGKQCRMSHLMRNRKDTHNVIYGDVAHDRDPAHP